MNAVFKNWQPTLGGILMALAQVLPQFGASVAVVNVVTAIGALILGAGAKQWNVTGGTKPQ